MTIRCRALAFILKKTDFREADQLFKVFTKDFGKLEILGKAIRKINSKLRAGINLFYLSETEFIQGKNYKTLTDAVAIDKFRNLRSDLEKLEIAYQVVELADSLIHNQEKDEQIWDLLNEVFGKLENYESRIKNYGLIYYYFFWNLLSILGYQIDLYNCAACHQKLFLGKNYFNPAEGGIICENCFGKINDGEEILPDIIKILRLFLEKNWQTLLKLKLSVFYERSLKEISDDYLSNI